MSQKVHILHDYITVIPMAAPGLKFSAGLQDGGNHGGHDCA